MADAITSNTTQEQSKPDWVILGMDGWIVGGISIVITIVGIYLAQRKVTTYIQQRRIKAGKNVAGGSIGTGKSPAPESVIQEDIIAGEDVAGGNIRKP